MFPQKPPKWAFGIVVGLVLMGIATALYNSGWSQGFTLGLLANGAEGADLATYWAYRGGGMGHSFFGAIFRFLFIFFAIGMVFKVLGFLRWRMQGGEGPPWQRHHGEHGHGRWQHGPWGHKGHEAASTQTEKDDGEASSAQAASTGAESDAAGESSSEEEGARPVRWDGPVINV